MESLNSYIMRKMKLRKILMLIFSACSILLIFGILNVVQESTPEYTGGQITQMPNISDSAEMRKDISNQKNPREILFEKNDRKIRMYSAFFFVACMAGAFLIDVIFVRCPVCSGHIQYAISPTSCSKCGCSFARKESEK